MSTIVGLFGPPAVANEEVARRMLAVSPQRGTMATQLWSDGGAVLAVTRPQWQLASGMSEGELVVRQDALAIVADASLYYRNDLVRALAAVGQRVEDRGPGSLILAAYRAWGLDCVDRLEGDWTFILWDADARLVFCARDFGGKRSLHYMTIGDGLVLATDLSAVRAHPASTGDWNLTSIAEAAAGFQASSHETCYRSIHRLGAGHSLRWRAGAPTISRFWHPRPQEGSSTLPFEAAAEHLRELIGASIEQRLSTTSETGIQLSGGWDSPTIFAIANNLYRRQGRSTTLRAVSISYPPGDPGREDGIIEMIIRHWNATTHWLNIANIPLLECPHEAATRREEPFAHVYERWNRSLVETGAALGTRVMLDGFGGDSLFQCSPVYLADLLRGGRILELRREWISKGMSGVGNLVRWTVVPQLPFGVRSRLSRFPGGGFFAPHLARTLPPWMDRRFVRAHGLLERERANTPTPSGGSQSERELFWHLTNPWVTRMLAQNYSFGLDAGVEVRSPLFDRRVIEFAITRPREERSHRKQTKRLLRASARGLLPDDVLAPRRYRTGMTTAYFQREMRNALTAPTGQVLTDPVLAELGIVDPGALRAAVERFIAHADVNLGVQLYFTLQTELWVRARTGTA